jgi:hypothetical protein
MEGTVQTPDDAEQNLEGIIGPGKEARNFTSGSWSGGWSGGGGGDRGGE